MSATYLYLNLIPESLVASNLSPNEYGSYMAVGPKFNSHGEAIFFSLKPNFKGEAFEQGDIRQLAIPHSDGSPKRSRYISTYRVLERVPIEALESLFLTTDDGRVLELKRGEFEPEPERELHFYQEFCPATPRVASRLTPDEFVKAITDPDAPVSFPRLVFADLILNGLASDPLGADIGNLPYRELSHLRQCLGNLLEDGTKATKNVNRRLIGHVNYRTIRRGFYVGDQGGMAFYPMPTREQLDGEHHNWWRSAQAISR